jgi:hypothetical protein
MWRPAAVPSGATWAELIARQFSRLHVAVVSILSRVRMTICSIAFTSFYRRFPRYPRGSAAISGHLRRKASSTR